VGDQNGNRAADDRLEPGHVMGPCDIAQTALFADILADEVAALRAQLREAERRWDERRSRRGCEVDTPARLVRLREQLAEAKRLSTSLRKLRLVAANTELAPERQTSPIV
jgi:hypothetical protein